MGLAWNHVGLKPARLDRTRVQAGAAELSGSRCPGCCQRLRAGEEPADGDGDRVAEKGGEAGSLQERGAWCGGHSSRRGGSGQDQRLRQWGPECKRSGLGAAGTQSLRNVHAGKERGAERKDSGLETQQQIGGRRKGQRARP